MAEQPSTQPNWLGDLVDQLPQALVVFGADGRILYANQAAHALMRVTPEQVIGIDAMDLVHPDDLDRSLASMQGLADGAQPLPGMIRLRRGDGEYQMLEVGPAFVRLPGLSDGPGQITATVIRDNSLQEAHWHFLAAVSAARPFDECMDILAIGLSNPTDGPLSISYESDGRRAVAGNVPALLTGVNADGDADLTPGTPWRTALLIGEPAWARVDDLPPPFRDDAIAFGAGACVAVPVMDPGGDHPALLLQWPARASMAEVLVAALIRRPRQAVMLALRQRDSVRRLEHLAHHDGLTGLANRERFFEVITELAAADDPYGVIYLDLDHFKSINDRFGHLVGDRLLMAVARRLERATPDGLVVARIGGDEFALVCTGPVADDLDAVAAALVGVLGQPFAIDGHRIEAGASVGHARADRGAAPDVVVGAADAAMYAAKRAGRGTWLAGNAS